MSSELILETVVGGTRRHCPIASGGALAARFAAQHCQIESSPSTC